MKKKPGFWNPEGFDVKGALDLIRQAMRSAEKSGLDVSGETGPHYLIKIGRAHV